jgi:pimeloyl-ACP methyl ester carboxylesterase
MGGLAAVRMAAQRPEKTLALILVSPGGSPTGPEGLSSVLERFEMDSWAKAHSFVDAFTGGPNRKRFDLAWGIRARVSRPSVRALVKRISSADLLMPDELQQLQMPILLVWGQDDEILDSEHLEFYRRHLHEGTELHTPEGMGHSPFLNRMEHFVDLMLEFCGRVPPKNS